MLAAEGRPLEMPISIHPLNPDFAGEVAGIDCREPLDPQVVGAIEAA